MVHRFNMQSSLLSLAATALFLFLFHSPLTAQRSLTLIYPNGGETFTGDETIEVRWTATGFDADERVELEYSLDGGGQWRNIDKATAGAGRIAWQVPNRPSGTVLARVSSRDGDISDVSDNTFEIAENPLDRTLMITPNGGETLTSGETFTLEWQLPLDAIEGKLEFSTDFGMTWQEVITLPASVTRYNWKVPEVTEAISTAIMRISVAEAPDHFDQSDAPFTLQPASVQQPSLHVIFPDGGESFPQDTVIAIEWEATNVPGEVEVEYSPDQGITWNGIGKTLAGIGGIAWKIPGKGTVAGLIRVRTEDRSVEDRSDNPFTIREKDDVILEPVTLLSPNGGEEWIEGESRTITWNAPADMRTGRLAYTTDGGGTWADIKEVTPSDGSYLWRVPHVADLPVTTMKVRITDTEHPTRTAESATDFTVAPVSSLSIFTPEEDSPIDLCLYPNPARTELRIDLAGTGESGFTVQLSTLQGKEVRRIDIGKGKGPFRLDVSDLPVGVYTCVIRTPGHPGIGKQVLIYR